MTLDLDELERKAKAANAGPWEARRRAHKDDWVIGNARMDVLAELRGPVTSANTLVQADAEHIAATNPSVVLALIERVRKAEADSKARHESHLSELHDAHLREKDLEDKVRTLEQDARELRTRINASLSTLSGVEHVVLDREAFDRLVEPK